MKNNCVTVQKVMNKMLPENLEQNKIQPDFLYYNGVL